MGLGLALGGAFTLAGAGVSAWSANQQGKAAGRAGSWQYEFLRDQARKREKALRELLRAGNFDWEDINATAAAQEALTQTGRALPTLIDYSKKINIGSAESFLDVMNMVMGPSSTGTGTAFEEQRGGVNQVVADQLAGMVAPGTRKLLARKAVGAGGTGLGRAAVGSTYTGYLGLTAEEQAKAGVANYSGLVNLYRAAVPLTSAMDLLPYGALSTAQSIGVATENARGDWLAKQAEANAVLEQIGQETQWGSQGINALGTGQIAEAQAQGQAGQAIFEGLGALAGMYYGGTNPALSSTYRGLPVYNQAQGVGAPSQYYLRSNYVPVRTALAV